MLFLLLESQDFLSTRSFGRFTSALCVKNNVHKVCLRYGKAGFF